MSAGRIVDTKNGKVGMRRSMYCPLKQYLFADMYAPASRYNPPATTSKIAHICSMVYGIYAFTIERILIIMSTHYISPASIAAMITGVRITPFCRRHSLA